MSIQDLTPSQLRQAAEIKEKIEALQLQLAAVIDGGEIPVPFALPPVSEPVAKKRKFSAAGLARLRAGQKARWANVKAGKAAKAEKKPRKKMSAKVRAKMAVAAKARWAKVKAAKTA